jgi:hypothetical protein
VLLADAPLEKVLSPFFHGRGATAIPRASEELRAISPDALIHPEITANTELFAIETPTPTI